MVDPPPELSEVTLTCATKDCTATWPGNPQGVWLSRQDFVFVEKQHRKCVFVEETNKWKPGRYTPSNKHRSMQSNRIKEKFKAGDLKPRDQYKAGTA